MTTKRRGDGRIPILYIAPWVDFGGTDTGTIDWFRWIDRSRFAPSLITTQPSPNRRLGEVIPYADEVWALPDLMSGSAFPDFILDFIQTRGVELVHIMNSRLAFNLIPDMECLSPSPAVVVQLHVEEEDRSGYVRYVATRYGNLVDGFSLTSEHLSRAIQDYDIPAPKCHVIYTGVDAIDAFNPDRVRQSIQVPAGVPNILYCARLCDQKDPMLMARIAAELHDKGRDFRIHVVGEGPLDEQVRAAVSQAGLNDKVLFHGAHSDMAPWYKCCDVMLMTSVYEGIPYVVYEAMAMAVPTVAPAIPGNVELLGDDGGILIDPRDDVAAYAESLERLMDDPGLVHDLGVRARKRVLDGFSLAQMGQEHGALYDELLGARPSTTDDEVDVPDEILFRTRAFRDDPLVSVVIPCYDHGGFLMECISSLSAQTYPHMEIIIVDDASRDEYTRTVLDNLSGKKGLKMIRLPENVGSSSARQIGIDEAKGRYILLVDADNHLTADAVASLVLQLKESGERIGFIYPNQNFFGQRNENIVVPEYNLDTLLDRNYCDTSSLIDREIFDIGIRYSDGLRWAHEDWDFALTLAERGVRGAPARGQYLQVRKSGFTRSDLVTHSGRSETAMRSMHAELYRRRSEIKARWSPALSIIAADPIENLDEVRLHLRSGLRAQTCSDAEIILRDDLWWWRDPRGPNVRRVAASHDASIGAAVATGLGMARGRYVMVIRGRIDELLADRTLIEKTLRVFTDPPGSGPIGFAHANTDIPAFSPLAEGRAEVPVALAWPVGLMGDHTVSIDHDDPLASLSASLLNVIRPGAMSWRQLPLATTWSRAVRSETARQGQGATARLAAGPQRILSESERSERDARISQPPLLPRRSEESERPTEPGGWHPALTRVLCRHVDTAGLSYWVTLGHTPPPNYVFQYELGSVFVSMDRSAHELVIGEGPTYRTVPVDEARRPDEWLLGYLEAIPLPLLDSIFLAQHRLTKQHVLVAGDDDPLLGDVDLIAHLGFIEPHPIRPRSGHRGAHHASVIEELARLQKTMAEFESEPARLRPIAELERVQMMADRYNQFAMSKPGRLAERFIDSGAMRSYRRLVARLSQVDPPNKAG
jgi:glycosyltransferase involved in cell wall biosynthesis